MILYFKMGRGWSVILLVVPVALGEVQAFCNESTCLGPVLRSLQVEAKVQLPQKLFLEQNPTFRQIGVSSYFRRSDFIVRINADGTHTIFVLSPNIGVIPTPNVQQLLKNGNRAITDGLFEYGKRGLAQISDDGTIRIFRSQSHLRDLKTEPGATLLGYIEGFRPGGRERYSALDFATPTRTYSILNDGSILEWSSNKLPVSHDFRGLNARFRGQYSSVSVARDKFLDQSLKVSELADSSGNLILFRVIGEPYQRKYPMVPNHGISYSLSPNIARTWEVLPDADGYVLISEQNILRDELIAGQGRITGNPRRLRADSKISEKADEDAGLNEVTLSNQDNETVVAIVPRRRFLHILDSMNDSFSLSQLLDKISGH